MSAAEKAITLVMFQLIWALHWCWLFSVILTTDLFQTCKAKGSYFTHEQCSCIFYVSACLLLLECPEEYMKTGHSSQTRVLLLQYYVWKDLWPTKPIHCGVVLVLHIALCLESQVLWSCSSDCLTVTVSLSLQRQQRISDRSFQGWPLGTKPGLAPRAGRLWASAPWPWPCTMHIQESMQLHSWVSAAALPCAVCI